MTHEQRLTSPSETASVVTLLMTDVQGCTRLWEAHPEDMATAMRALDELVERVVTHAGGTVVKARGEGDSHFCVFGEPAEALRAARDLQVELASAAWPIPQPLKLRASVHTGPMEQRGTDFYGTEVNRAARIRALAHGGQTLVSRAARAGTAVLPDGVTLRDLGEYELKDLTTPERLYQIEHPKLERDFPPLVTFKERLNNLPLQVTSFIGRRRELDDLRTLVVSNRLVTVVGPGGSGKSRLALEVGAELSDRFEDGAWLVELAAVDSDNEIDRAIARALRAPEPGDIPIRDALISFMKRRSLVLIVDNAEHLIDGVASSIQALLTSCEHVHILVTSREALRLDGEHVYPLGPLQAPNPEHLPPPEELESVESLALFCDRARLADPSFALTDENARAIAQICHRLDGIPLAIELATARIASIGPQQLATRLDDMFRLLTGGRRTALPRHRTLRALIDWSYNLLDDQAKLLLERLSVFAGGATLEAVEDVCTDDSIAGQDVVDVLAGLVDKSLVVAEPVYGTLRYRLMETVRQYAADRLMESGSMHDLRTRHMRWFAEVGTEFIDGDITLKLGTRGSADLRRRWPDLANLRRALEWAIDEVDPDQASTIALYAADLLTSHGSAEGRRWLADALALRGADPGIRVQALVLYWELRNWAGEADVPTDAIDEALAVARSTGRVDLILLALATIGRWAIVRADLPAARRAYEEALALSREHALDDREAGASLGLAKLSAAEGDVETRRAHIERAVRLATGSLRRMGALREAASFELQQDDFARAESLLQEAERLCAEADCPLEHAYILFDIAAIKHEQYQHAQVDELLMRAERIASDTDNFTTAAQARWLRGWHELERGNPTRARALFVSASRTFADHGMEGAAWDVRCAEGLAASHQGDLESAGRIADEVASGAGRKDRPTETMILLLVALGRIDDAERVILTDVGRTSRAKNHQFYFHRMLGRIRARQGRQSEAMESYRLAMTIAREAGYWRSLSGRYLAEIGEMLATTDPATAIRLLGAAASFRRGRYEIPSGWAETVRAALGAETFEALRSEGARLSKDEAHELVMIALGPREEDPVALAEAERFERSRALRPNGISNPAP